MKWRFSRSEARVHWPFLFGFVVLFSSLGILYALAKSSVWFQPSGVAPRDNYVSVIKVDDQGLPTRMLWQEAQDLQSVSGIQALWPYGSLEREVLTTDGNTRKETVAVLDWPLLKALGVRLALGQLPEASENSSVLISYRFWQRHFTGDPHVVGRSVRFKSGLSLPVAGVLSEALTGLAHDNPAIWMNQEADIRLEQHKYETLPEGNIPAGMDAKIIRIIRQNRPGFYAFGLLRDHSVLAAVNRELREKHKGQAVVKKNTGRISVAFDLGQAGSSYQAIEGLESLPAQRKHIANLLGLLGLTALLLAVVVLGNYVLLLLSELETGVRETAIHVLAGATRKHLFVLQLKRVAPTLLLALVIALPVMRWISDQVADLPPFDGYFSGLFSPDGWPLLWVGLLAVSLAVLVSLLLTRQAVAKADGRQKVSLDTARHRRLNAVLAVLQLALGGVMLALALNAAWAFLSTRHAAPPLNLENTYYLEMERSNGDWVSDPELVSWLADLQSQPGLSHVLATLGPYQKSRRVSAFVALSEGNSTQGIQNKVDRDFFTLIGLKPLAGEIPGVASEGDAVASLSLAKALFGSATKALGQSVTVEGATSTTYRISAVVADVPYGDSLEKPRPVIYPLGNEASRGRMEKSRIVLHGSQPENVLKRQLETLADSYSLGIKNWQPATEAKSVSTRGERAGLITSIALSTLLMVMMLVGVLAFARATMHQWRKKLALHVAMGATRASLYRLVFGFALKVLLVAFFLAVIFFWLLRSSLPLLLQNAGNPVLFLLLALSLTGVVFVLTMGWQLRRQLGRSPWAELSRD